MDSIADIYVCNNLRLMTDFNKKLTKIGGSIADEMSPNCETVQIRLALEDSWEKIILNL